MSTAAITPKWHTTAEVALMLGFGLSKTKTLVLTGNSAPSRSAATAASSRPGWTSTYSASPPQQRRTRHEREAR